MDFPGVINGGAQFRTPATNPPSVKYLTVGADGVLAYSDGPSAGIGGSLGSTDNVVPRSDATGGATLQASALSIDDTAGATLTGTAAKLTVSNTTTSGNLITADFFANTSGNRSIRIGKDTSNYIEIQQNGGGFGRISNISAGAYSTFRVLGTGFSVMDSATSAVLLFCDNTDARFVRPVCPGKYTVATLPTPGIDGLFAYATNGRTSSETAGNGSGVPVYAKSSAWKTFYDNTTVAA